MMKKMRRILALAAVLALCICWMPALAETMYVQTDDGQGLSLRDENSNTVLCYIPNGTAVVPDPDRSTDLSAYVTYEGQSGFVLWRYLTRTAPGQPVKGDAPSFGTAAASGGTSVTMGGFEISVTGATVALNADGDAVITASLPAGASIGCWVFNGVRYNFDGEVTEIRVHNPDRSWAIEAVPADAEAQTLLSAEQIQANRTGARMVVEGVHAELSHVDSRGNAGGGWRRSFNFTNDYQNQRTRYRELGGQISVRVRAVIPAGKYVCGWKFDETEFYPNAVISTYEVRSLNTCMTYEPIFSSDPNYQLPKVNVTCIRCTFTGGGYTNATHGQVPIGTNITVNGEGGYGSWTVNGSYLMTSENYYLESYSITRTITTNTTIVFYLTIN